MVRYKKKKGTHRCTPPVHACWAVRGWAPTRWPRARSFDTADPDDAPNAKRRRSAETAPRGVLRMQGGRRVRSFDM